MKTKHQDMYVIVHIPAPVSTAKRYSRRESIHAWSIHAKTEELVPNMPTEQPDGDTYVRVHLPARVSNAKR